VNSDLRHLSCRATVAHEPADAAAFGHAFMEVATGLGLRPGRMITTGKGRKLDANAFARDLSDRSVEHVAVWNDKADEGARAHLYVRDGDHPGIDEFTDRATELIVPVSAVETLMACLGILDRHFRLVSANVAAHRDYGYAWKEAVRRGVPGTWDAATVERIRWDAAHWRDARTKLIRLSPITIIGPSIWATLPPMPTFDPMPRVEDLGDCKVLTAWPTLCEPRDPAFLRGTRDLRAWLWPYTIQNPADHVDRDPPPA
jgi:hypothetical protein